MIRRLLYRLHLVHSPSKHLTVSCWCQKGQPPPDASWVKMEDLQGRPFDA